MAKLKTKLNNAEPLADKPKISEDECQISDQFAEMVVLKSKKQRFWELDFLRGICVILMVFYHFFYSAVDILYYVQQWVGKEFWSGLMTFSEQFLVNRFISVAHYVVVGLFLFLCGISCTLARNNALRGFKTLGFALIITIVTYLADSFGIIPGIMISFGVIHMLACAMLLFSLVDLIGAGLQKLVELIENTLAKNRSKRSYQKLNQSVSAIANQDTRKTAKQASTLSSKSDKSAIIMLWVRRILPALVGILGIVLFFTIPLGHFGTVKRTVFVNGQNVDFYPIRLLSDIAATDSRGLNNFLSMLLNLDRYSFKSSDYFPILPYAFVLLLGGTAGRLVYGTRAKTTLAHLDGKWNKPVCFVGRHAMLVYLVHQLIIVAFFFAAGGIYKLFI